jgi:hypothetical protein
MISQTGGVCLSTSFKKLLKLKSLDISNNEINDFGIDYILSSITHNLQCLDISSNEYTHVESITNISLLTNLLELKIRYSNIGIGVEEFASYLSNMVHLTSLDITGNSLRNNGLITIIKNLPNLKSIKLCGNSIDDNGIIWLAEHIKLMPALVEIDLAWNNATNSSFDMLERSKVTIIGRNTNDDL